MMIHLIYNFISFDSIIINPYMLFHPLIHDHKVLLLFFNLSLSMIFIQMFLQDSFIILTDLIKILLYHPHYNYSN